MNTLRKAGITGLAESALPRWKDEAAAIARVLRDHHGDATYQLVKPMPAAAKGGAMGLELRAVAPSLATFVDELTRQLKTSCGVFIPQLGLGSLDTNSRAMLVYAIGVCIGEPTATDTHRVIWDVKCRPTGSEYFSTFSETDLEAAYHSDTQYYPNPEEAFLLYTVEAAACGGGWSRVCDARGLRAELDRTAPWVSRELVERPLPFRVPTAFMTIDRRDVVQATIAPVFGHEPFIRYRRDTLEDGLLHFPEYGDGDVHRALDAFEECLAACAYSAEFFMPRDGLMLLDNHHALHARTGFHDMSRHLLRVRLRQGSVADSTRRLVTRPTAHMQGLAID